MTDHEDLIRDVADSPPVPPAPPDPDHVEAAQRLAALLKTNGEMAGTLQGRGAILEPLVVFRERLDLLVTMLAGPLDLDDLAATAPMRLGFELAWQEKRRSMLSKALVETSNRAPEIAVPESKLILPPNH